MRPMHVTPVREEVGQAQRARDEALQAARDAVDKVRAPHAHNRLTFIT